jgi:hypothetical protein
MLSPRKSQLARFPRQHLVLQPSSLPSEFDWPRKRPLDPHCPGAGTSLPEVENPTGREYNFSLSRQRRVAVTAEAASSSPVVPAIHSKAVRQISLNHQGRKKDTFRGPFVPLFSDPQFPIQQRLPLLTYRKKRRAILPPPALLTSRALRPACKHPT